MNAADLLDRAERRAKTVHLTTRATKIALIAAAGLALYCSGQRAGRTQAGAAQLHAVLDSNQRRLDTARAHADTTKRVAIAHTAALSVERVATRAADARVAIVDDSTVRLRTIDSILVETIPPVVVTELEADRAQIQDDSVVIDLWIANDSAQTTIITRLDERTQLLEGAVRDERHAALRRGEEIGAVAAGLLAIVVRFVLR